MASASSTIQLLNVIFQNFIIAMTTFILVRFNGTFLTGKKVFYLCFAFFPAFIVCCSCFGCVFSSFSVGEVKKHKIRWKCSCSRGSDGDSADIRLAPHDRSATAASTVWSRFSSFSVAICFPEINIFPTLIGVLFLNIMEKPEKVFRFFLFFHERSHWTSFHRETL